MKGVFKLIYWGAAMLWAGFSIDGAYAQLKPLGIKTSADLHAYFKYAPSRPPLIWGHRGGAAPGLPENCIETLAQRSKTVTQFFEVDPRLTKDSVLVLMHDDKLDRTTDGKGLVRDYTWNELKKFRLKDADGKLTSYKIPTLQEALKWSKGKAILILDKKDVPMPVLAKKLKEWNAIPQVIISTYSASETKFYYEQDKDFMLEAFIMNDKEVAEFKDTGVPWSNIIAYVSKPKSKAFYDVFHSKGVMCIVYSAKVIEKLSTAEERVQGYRAAINGGADILLSNRVEETAQTVSNMTTPDK